MRAGARLATVWLWCLVGVLVGATPALGEGQSSALVAPVEGGGVSASLGGSLVTPGSPTAGEQLQAAREATLANPEAVAAREASRTRFEGLTPAQARAEAAAAFPSAIEHPAGGPPQLPAGQKVVGFDEPDVAQVDLGGGQAGIVESNVPMAMKTASGGYKPVDLSLNDTGAAFEPASPLVSVRVPKHLGEGVRFPASGISLTPVDSGGAPLGGAEGTVNGATVDFANTQTDVDTVVKPTPLGVEASALLRSAESPEQLYYKVGLPQGARLVQDSNGADSVDLVKEGTTIGHIAAPTARDAAGTEVPSTMSVSGDVLTVTVRHRGGSYMYPIMADPEFVEVWSNIEPGNWEFLQSGGYTYELSPGHELWMQHEREFSNKDYGEWVEWTKGYTKIYEVYAKYMLYAQPIEGSIAYYFPYISIFNSSKSEHAITGLLNGSEATVCANSGCTPEGVSNTNGFEIAVTTQEASPPGAWATFYVTATQVSTAIAQEKGLHSSASFNETPNEINGTPNVLHGRSRWLGPSSGAVEITAEDGGLGVSQVNVEYDGAHGWETYGSTNYRSTGSCQGVQCSQTEHVAYTYNTLTENGKKPLSEPQATIGPSASSAMPDSFSGQGGSTIKVDAKPPSGIHLSGLESGGTEEELNLGEVQGHFTVEASDGNGEYSSGIKSITVGIDGHEIGKPSGDCSPGPCTASGEWSINGAELGTGEHELTVVATDNAGNVASKSYELDVHRASPVAMGPGSVNPESGDFALESSDVDLSGGMGSLTASRHYDSRNLVEGVEGPLGPQWSVALGSVASLEVLPDKSVMVVGPDGLTHFSVKEGGGFEAPEGDTNLTLEYNASTPAYLLKNPAQGTTIEFTLPKGSTVWVPTVSRGPVATDTITDEYRTVEIERKKTVVEPTLELAPHPNLTCAPEKMEKGCRGLEFVYDESQTATGESRAGWGSYKNRLKEIVAVAWNSSADKMEKKAVAAYEYDAKGRLRAEWDPRISPTLKTVYGYDSEGHVVAVTAPGQQPWLLHYAVTTSDPNTGRLVSTTRPSAATGSWDGEALSNTKAPSLSTTSPTIGATLSVSSGTWSNDPLAYSYQWEDCNYEGQECVPIVGGINQSYTPQATDAGYTLMAVVTAENAGGAVKADTAFSNSIAMPKPSFADAFGFGVSNGEAKLQTCTSSCRAGTAGSGEGQFKEPNGLAVDSSGNVWVADTQNNRIEKFSSSGGYIGSYTHEGIKTPEAVAVDPVTGNVYVSNSGGNRIEVMSSSGEFINFFGGSLREPLSSPDGITFDSAGNVWVADSNNDRIVEFSATGTLIKSVGSAGSGEGQFSYPLGIAYCGGELYVVDWGNSRVERFSTEGKYEGQFGKQGSSNGEFNSPSRIACEPAGADVYVTDKGNNRVQTFTDSGVFLNSFGASGHEGGQFSTPIGVAVGPGGVVYVADGANDRIEKWTPNYSTNNPLPEPPSTGTGSVSTIEYGVPISGSGAPNEMGKSEVAKWGQKDDPAYATSIFPPDEPMGWPAKDYKRAATYYLDNRAQTVNQSSPTGGITTSEYNEDNEATRTLSADDRALALKEECKSGIECKSAEVAELLDTKNKYGNEGTQLTETIGPQHTVKIASGKSGKSEETLARNQVHYYYDEGAPEGETYDLATKTVSDSLTASGGEFDKRTSLTSYGGQKGLGWKLRQPTSTTTDPTDLALTQTTEYNETTGSVIETKAPGGTSVAVPPPSFSLSFGSEGTGNGQFKRPVGVATDASGHVWVNDRENDRIERFSATGSWEGSYGSKGSGAGQMEGSWDLAVNQSTGNVYVGDSWNDRIDEFNSAGEFVETFGWGVSDGKEKLEVCKTGCKGGLGGSGEGQLSYPLGIAIDSHGDIWVVDLKNNRIEEFSEAGAYVTAFGAKGSGNGQLNEPNGIAIDEGEVYVTDQGNHRVEEFSPTGAYLNQFGSEGTAPGQFREPTGIAVNPNSSDIYVADESYNRVEEFSPAGKFLVEFGSYGTGSGHFEHPTTLAVNAGGDLYVGEDTGERVDEWLPPGAGGAHMTYSTQFGSAGSGSEQFNEPIMSAIDGQGDVWVTDFNHARVKKFTAQGKFLASYGSYGTGEGQFEAPTGIAINQGTGNVYVSDCEDNRIEELSSSGGYVRAFGGYGSEPGKLDCPMGVKIDSSGDVWVADAHNNRIEEYSSAGTFKAAYGSKGTGNKEFEDPSDIAISGSDIYVADSGNRRVQELTTSGEYVAQFGNQGDGGGQFVYPEAIATDAAGHLFVVDFGNDRVEEFSAGGQFLGAFASHGTGEGQLNGPRGIAISPAGDAYVADTENNRIEIWASTNQATHDTKTIYYTAGGEAEVEACRNHPEWVDLPCRTEPAAQPEDSLKLPVTTIAYNMWDQAEKIEETFGSTTRTKKTTFDTAGRPLTTEDTASVDEPLPKVTDTYNAETGALETQSTTTGEKARMITNKYNTLGQLVKYTDADGATTTYTYEEGGDDRLEEVVMDGPEGEKEREKGKQTYSYDPTTGFMTKLVDSAAGTFTAGYDVEGEMTSETYPNGMTATYTHDQTGATTGISYVKNAHCASTCPETWFSDTVVPSSHGETSQQTSTLAKESYAYDSAGRLAEVQETPASKHCTARLYAYDEESNRLSLSTRESSTETCPTEGGTTERHTYDEANRLTDEGITYDALGNATKLPATDAGQYELTSSFYVDGQAASQTQHEKTITYGYDPEGRTRETTTTVKGKAEPAVISHYAASGGAVAWLAEGSEKWTRDIPGIDGTLTAVQSSGGTPVLQLHDLNGNIVATAGLSETETKLLSTYNSTEFGVPSENKEPPKYAWLGAGGITSELPSGAVAKDGITYVPLTGRALQTQPVEIPDPVNAIVPFSDEAPSWIRESAGERAAYAGEIARAAEHALGGAADPPGGVPSPGGGIIPPGDLLCMNACAASQHSGFEIRRQGGDGAANCSIWTSWGSVPAIELTIHGHWECTSGNLRGAAFLMQIALLVESGPGKFTMIDKPAEEGWGNHPISLNKVYSFDKGFACSSEHAIYRAWAYGALFTASSGFNRVWWQSGIEREAETECRDALGNSGPTPGPTGGGDD